jgi:hypothetical protein
MNKLVFGTILLLLCAGAMAQVDSVDSVSPPPRQVRFDLPVPEVRFNNRAVMFQAELYPEFYATRSAAHDLRWVRENDSALATFWESKGDSTLWLLTQYSGLDWVEDRFDLYILRYYPSSGGSDPLVIPIGGVRRGGTTIAAPPGAVQKFNLIYQLAHRMIAQSERADDPLYRSMAGHPLMQPGPFRRDNLAMLLATVTAQKIIGLDSTFEAYQSDFCRKMHEGREVFEKFLLTQWALTPERPLLQWVLDESPLSAFVEATRAPARAADSLAPAQEYVEGLPIKGQLGVSVKTGDNNRLILDQVDTLRLAYACGLRVGDVIRSVDGKRPRTHRQLIEFVLAGLDRGGSTVSVLRHEADVTVVLRPGAFASDKDQPFRRFEETEDTLIFESTPPDTTRNRSTGPR